MLIDIPQEQPEELPPEREGKLRIVVKRIPWDEQLTVFLPGGSSEYVFVDKAERLLRSYGVKNPDTILDHVWNFYTAVLYVDDPAYKLKN